MYERDVEWLEKCKQNPKKYKIYIDRYCVEVCDLDDGGEVVYTFCECGSEFILQLLQYTGCNADIA